MHRVSSSRKPATRCAACAAIGPEPSDPDSWACPICGKDARPYVLRVDDFMVAVRDRLVAQSKDKRAKSILVCKDGMWEAVLDVKGDDDTDTEDDDDELPLALRARGEAARPSGAPLPARRSASSTSATPGSRRSSMVPASGAAPSARRREPPVIIEIDDD
jgi:hypothetical protein